MSVGSNRMDEHLIDARVENARFLMGECEMSLEHAAERIGVDPETLQQNLRRDDERRRTR